MKRLCLYCGSNSGRLPQYQQAVKALVSEMVKRDIGVVYGGARVGLMGVVADTALALGGEVIGVIPEGLITKEVAHQNLSQLEIVKSMHERKARMVELSDGFIALPGGAGTMDELFEVYTWAQLGLHNKPCALFDVDNYFAGIIEFLSRATEDQFLRPAHHKMLLIDDHHENLLNRMAHYEAPVVKKWIGMDQA
ncbi:MAG: TIGR00730 family Rossman fold protein [Xanthomonadales bacterium]|nr:TIGR00730 family Rossman fold protein [Xanthomonadales bacterium]